MNIKKLIISILIPVAVGTVIGLITMPFNDYSNLNQPPLAPPAIAFPIVWTILYILMGISAYMVSESRGKLDTYYLQLFVNSLWRIIFFIFKLKLLAFIWILLLIYLVIKMIREFLSVYRPAGLLQIPYLLWLVFAAYLNLGVYILN